MAESESFSKSHLIKHVCDISNHANIRAHHNAFHTKPFIDWYILFQVEDNVGVDVIRKKYHKYALLLHPDKNNHPKAEFAFKLVSEAYACLSDDARRLEFDVKRSNNLQATPQTRTKVKGSSSSSSSDRSRSKKISTRLKEVKVRFMEEVKVIEKCLRANANVDVFDKEMPVFDPNDYATREYPHFRVWRCKESKSSSKCLKKLFELENQVKCDSPVFECKPNRPSFKLKSIPMSI